MPMNQDPKHGWESQFSTYKQGIFQQIMESIAPIDYLDVDMANVKLNVQADGKVAWISNFSLDSYDQIKWHVSHLTSQKARLIRYQKNGVGVEDIDIKLEDGIATIDEELKPLETIQLIFK